MYISKCQKSFYCEDFTDDYRLLDELGINSGYIYGEGEDLIEIVPNVKVCIYSNPKEFDYEQAKKMIIDKYFGSMSAETQDYGYSEYTIEGFEVYSLKIGNHDLIQILNSNDNYKIFTIEKL